MKKSKKNTIKNIEERHLDCKKITLSALIIRTYNYNVNKKKKALLVASKSQTCHILPYDDISKTHLYRDGLHLNRIGFTIIADNVLCFIWRD